MFETIEEAYESFRKGASDKTEDKLSFLGGIIAAIIVLSDHLTADQLLSAKTIMAFCKKENDRLANETFNRP